MGFEGLVFKERNFSCTNSQADKKLGPAKKVKKKEYLYLVVYPCIQGSKH